jgi:hypothetical protein
MGNKKLRKNGIRMAQQYEKRANYQWSFLRDGGAVDIYLNNSV